jgi:apolipoprotein N-acyltransferase
MNRLRALAGVIMAHSRWAAGSAGALAATGFEPLHLWPLTLLAMALLIDLIARAATWKRALLIGWLFGLGHFTLADSWLAQPFVYQTEMPAWLGWLAPPLTGAYLAIWPALACAAAWRIGRRNYGAMVLAFAGCWIFAEWLRGWMFTGFPLSPLASVALGGFDSPGLAQVLPLVGTYALSGLVCLLAGSWLIAARRGTLDWRGAALVLLPVALMLLPHSASQQPLGGTQFTLVQPNVPQERLNDPANFESQFRHSAALSAPRGRAGPRLVLWPESGTPDYLQDGYPAGYYGYTSGHDPVLARRRIGQAIGPDAMLLTGTVDLEFQRGRAVGARNSVTVLDGSGTIRGSYAKAHLVPFGEYVPLRPLLEPLGLARLVPGDFDFWPGPGPRTLNLGGFGKAGLQVCYEIVFSGQVVDRDQRPDYIVNPFNDGWYGPWGPPQHLAQARLRAIEEGLPVLRATTTGISAVIDADGVVRQYVPLGRAGRIDGAIPPAHPPTLFARAGNALPLGWGIVLLALSLVASRLRRR